VSWTPIVERMLSELERGDWLGIPREMDTPRLLHAKPSWVRDQPSVTAQVPRTCGLTSSTVSRAPWRAVVASSFE